MSLEASNFNFNSECLVLISGSQRVEMHIRCADEICTLYAFSGEGDHPPERHLQQGPFQRPEEAMGARRAVAQSLMASGFRLAEQQNPIWLLPLQREVRAGREQRRRSAVDCRFDPKDVYLDW